MGFDTPTDAGAPTDAEYVVGSSDPDLSSEVVVSPAADILVLGDFTTSTALSPGFDSWTQVDADNPSLVILQITAQTDGTDSADIEVQVDESGGTTSDYSPSRAFADKGLGSGGFATDSATIYLPAGARFQISNAADPNNGNSIDTVRSVVISP